MSNNETILICDDQLPIHETLSVYLESEGYKCISAYDGNEAEKYISDSLPDLIILDIMMPGKSGIDVCKKLRADNIKIPIIMLTARSEEIDRILCLELGADDYIVKPFSAREVVARIRAILRRYVEQKNSPAKVIHQSSLEVNINNYSVRINGTSVRFTPKEVEILQLLAGSPGHVFSREQILSKVWGYDYFGDERAVDTQIKRIRQKFPENLSGWQIKTIYGVGYKFEADN